MIVSIFQISFAFDIALDHGRVLFESLLFICAIN